MEVIKLPPINLSPVATSVATWTFIEAQQPVDFTVTLDGAAWSAEFLIENCGRVAWRAPATLSADGGVSVTVPQAISAALRSVRRIDAEYQILFTAPVTDFATVWRGPVVVLEITP